MGNWKTETDQIRPGDLYKIVLDDKEYPDPASLSQPEGVHGFSKAINIHDLKMVILAGIIFPLRNT